jgi:hypothetical protein
MKLTQSSILLASALMLSTTEAFMSVSSLATTKNTGLGPFMARSENSKRTNNRRNNDRGRGGPSGYMNGGGGGGGGGGEDFDYSAGNLKYGTGKYTQRGNDQGGVNVSQNGRSMQDSVYREDRRNVDRARGRARQDFGRMDEVEDLERGMGGNHQEGMRDRMMRNRGGRGGMMRDANDMNMNGEMYQDMMDGGFEGGQGGIRDRMGGGGLLRDMQGDRGGRSTFDDFGAAPTIMGGSSHGRGGGYRSSQFQNGISNERRRNEEFGGRGGMDDYYADRDGFVHENGGRRRGGAGQSNFDRMMGRDGRDEFIGRDFEDDYNHFEGGQDFRRGGGGRGRDRREEGRFEDFGEDFGPERGGGGLLRDRR